MIRKPVVAGSFYTNDFSELDKEIKNCYKHELGAGTFAGKVNEKRRIIGAVAPHAGYVYSGACASWVYKNIGESRKPDCFVIIGPNHTGLGSGISIMAEGEWETPFGRVKINSHLANEIWKSSSIIDKDSLAHSREHSIEVQLPFLQFIYKNMFEFVPIAISGLFYDYETCKKISNAIVSASKGREITVIASSDFTHYGENYGYVLKSKNPKMEIEKSDKSLIKKYIEKLDAKNFLKFSKDTSICGAGAIAVALLVSKELGAKKAELLKYYTSGDIVGDYSNFVGYAGIIIE